MKTVLLVVRWACVLAGVCGALVAVWAFIDPSAFPRLRMEGLWAPPSPRWPAAFLFLFSLLMIGFGTGWLRHRKLP